MAKKYDESKYKVARETYNSGVVYTGMTLDGEEVTDGFDTREEAENELERLLLVEIKNAKKDLAIRHALRDADEKGKLLIVAAVTGVQGGEQRLREILDSDSPLGLVERSVLVMHLS